MIHKIEVKNISTHLTVVTVGSWELCYSYEKLIAAKHRGKVYLDSYYHNITKTTTNHRNTFLGLTGIEVQQKIKLKEYTVCFLRPKIEELTRDN